MKTFIPLLLPLAIAATLQCTAQNHKVARTEGHYTAHYQWAGEGSTGNYTETGTVVYYMPGAGDTKSRTVYDIYPETVVDNSADTTVATQPAAIRLLESALWPVPGAEGAITPASETTADGITTINYDLKESRGSGSEKALRAMGLNMDIESATGSITLDAPDPQRPAPGSIRAMNEAWTAVLNGRQYRRIFGGKPVTCNAQISITFDKAKEPAIIPAKEAKAQRKSEQHLWKATHKKQ